MNLKKRVIIIALGVLMFIASCVYIAVTQGGIQATVFFFLLLFILQFIEATVWTIKNGVENKEEERP